MLRVLKRQIDKLGLASDRAPSLDEWRAFLHGVKRTYAEVDEDRYTLERSLMMSSREMLAVHDELRRSEANFKALVEQLPDAIFVVAGGRVRYANTAMAALLDQGDPSSLVDADPVETFVARDDRALFCDFQQRRGAGESTGTVALRLVRNDDVVITARALGAPITFNGEPALLVVARDITDALRAEEQRATAERALRISEERYRLLFDSSPLSIVLFDPTSLRILAVNAAAVRLYGYTVEEFLSLHLVDLKVAEDVADLPRELDASRENLWQGTKKHRRKDGELIDMEISSHAVTIDGQGARIAIGNDVTQRRLLENQLRQAQKMDAFGQLAGGVAHDFNNMLAVILSYADLVSLDLGAESPVAADLQEIASAARRGAALTRQLLTFSRKESWHPKIVALNPLVANLQSMLSRIIGEEIELSAVLGGRVESIRADPGQLEQVLMNLVVNARDAMPKGGRITIATKNVRLDEASGRALGGSPGRYVRAHRERHGHRNGCADPSAHLRAVLHDQGGRQGHGAGALHRVRHREAERRRDRGSVGGWPRLDLRGVLPARHGGDGGGIAGSPSGGTEARVRNCALGRGRPARAGIRSPATRAPRLYGDRGNRRATRARSPP